jgi:tRNA pseudouridine55 synthase
MARSKRLLGSRKAGHTGTLDPFATGLLPIAFGEATKFSRFLIDSAKTYQATLELGVESTTGDTEGVVTAGAPFAGDEATIDEVLGQFHGFSDQLPPMHSAVRVGGKRLYQLAREGLDVPRDTRRIEISSLRRLSLQGSALTVEVACSKGTYVRVLAQDIGRSLGCGAYLKGLRRLTVAGFDVADAATLPMLEAAGVEGARARLLPLEVMVAALPEHAGDADQALRFTQGQAIEVDGAPAGTEMAVFGPSRRFVGVGRCLQPGWLAPLRLLATGGKSPDFA